MIQSAYDTTKLITAHEGAGSNRILSYLPLSHVAGFLLDLMIPIYIPTALGSNLTLYFARPYDLKDGTFGQRLNFVQPSIFAGVPRVWEKISEKMKSIGAKIKQPMKSI